MISKKIFVFLFCNLIVNLFAGGMGSKEHYYWFEPGFSSEPVSFARSAGSDGRRPFYTYPYRGSDPQIRAYYDSWHQKTNFEEGEYAVPFHLAYLLKQLILVCLVRYDASATQSLRAMCIKLNAKPFWCGKHVSSYLHYYGLYADQFFLNS